MVIFSYVYINMYMYITTSLHLYYASEIAYYAFWHCSNFWPIMVDFMLNQYGNNSYIKTCLKFDLSHGSLIQL